MKSLIYYSLAAMTCILAGCATVKVPAAMGGSKADGTITMGFPVGGFEKPVVDWEATRREASMKCRAWGYSDADPFGGQKVSCNAYDGYGNCVQSFVSTEYQCTGGQTGKN